MTALLTLGAFVLMPILAFRGVWYRGAYGAVALLALILAFVVASPWPTGQGSTAEAEMIADYMNRSRGDFGLLFVALAVGAVLGAMLYRRPTPPA